MLLQKTVVITGAASGIGRALATQFAENGKKVIAVDFDIDGLARLKDQFEKFAWPIQTLSVDVSNPNSLANAVAGIDFDIWINNAGIHGNGEFLETDPTFAERVLSVNTLGVVHGTRIALDHFGKKGTGAIVNMASLSGLVPSPYMSLYSASKHAVVGFTRSLQAELNLNRSSVHVLLVCPGFVKTPLLTRDPVHQFPPWLEWTLNSPESVSRAVMKGLKSKRLEIVPGLNGKIIRKILETFPRTSVPMARVLLAESPMDLVLRRLKRPIPKTSFKEESP